jgi:hypothetical protein
MATVLCIVLSKELSTAGNSDTLYQPIFRASFLHTCHARTTLDTLRIMGVSYAETQTTRSHLHSRE